MITVGIDPDKGWAVVRNKKVIDSGTTKGMAELEKTIDFIAKLARDAQVDLLVRIERPINLKTFPRPGLSVAANMKISHNVGMNYEKCEELGRYCQSLGYRYEFIVPSRRKLSAKEFKQITGFNGKLSQHARDAAMLALK